MKKNRQTTVQHLQKRTDGRTDIVKLTQNDIESSVIYFQINISLIFMDVINISSIFELNTYI